MRLAVDPSVGVQRRRLETLACCVLEEVVLRADHDGAGVLSSLVGAWELASALRISKDNQARGLGWLTQAGLVRRETNLDDAERLGHGWYVLSLPVSLACERCEPLTDALNHTTTYTYDAAGRRLTTNTPIGNVTTDANESSDVGEPSQGPPAPTSQLRVIPSHHGLNLSSEAWLIWYGGPYRPP